jgi:hypothetical protein
MPKFAAQKEDQDAYIGMATSGWPSFLMLHSCLGLERPRNTACSAFRNEAGNKGHSKTMAPHHSSCQAKAATKVQALAQEQCHKEYQ